MKDLWRNRWLQIGPATFVVGIALGLAIWAMLLTEESDAASVGDRALLTTGGGVISQRRGLGAGEEIFEVQLPLTAAAAVGAGWVDPVFCSPGRGRYFGRVQAGVAEPYFLMYDTVDRLIGIYMLSDTEMPAPWLRTDLLQGSGAAPVVDHEHWGLYVYFQEPTRACTRSRLASSGGTSYSGPHAVRSYEGPPTPTPAPTPGQALQAAAANLAALASLTYSLSTEPEGLDLKEDVAPGSIGAIVMAIQGPTEAASKWIDNKSHRGISGTVNGEDLAGLVPSAAGEAVVTITIWLGETDAVRQIRIEGAAAPGDPDNAIRILDVSPSN